jgi:hypothetical protein
MFKPALFLSALVVGAMLLLSSFDQADALPLTQRPQGSSDLIVKIKCWFAQGQLVCKKKKHDHQDDAGNTQATKDRQDCYRYCDTERAACDVPGVSDAKKNSCSNVRILCQQECDREFR